MSSSIPSEYVFDDLTPIQIIYSIGGEKYLLVEADGDAATQFQNAAIRGARMSDGKIVGMDGVADSEPLLVSLCLFKAVEKEDKGVPTGELVKGARVPLSRIKSWPQRVQRSLFDKAKEISGLDMKKETKEGLEKQLSDIQVKLGKLTSGEEKN